MDERAERFDAVVRASVDPLRRFLARRTDAETADDVLADTYLVAWRRFEDIPDEPLPWLYGVARNCLANAERGVRRRARLAARLAEEPATAPGSDDASAVLEALATLPEADRELIRLWAWEGLGPADIATVLATTPNAVSVRLTRARHKLRDRLRKTSAVAGHEGT